MVKEKWIIYGKKADFNRLSSIYKISPIVARIIRNRNIIDDKDFDMYLNGTIDFINSPFLFKDMDKAVDILLNAVEKNKKIRVIGDYDIDGICSTYILTKGIELIGGNVSMDIPDRVKDGYGINENIIKKAYEDKVGLIITCDNGIAAIEEIKLAKSLGITVIVTDHHNVPFEEINGEKIYKRVIADATVNQKQPDCKYPFKELCGGGIAYRFMIAVAMTLQKLSDDRANKIYTFEEEMIVFAAIATIGDVVSLTGENRIIAKTGLKLIKSTSNIGLKALIEKCELRDSKISSFHIGFIIGPCLNATGRLDTAKMGYELLNCNDMKRAEKLAMELVELNNTRKNLTKTGEIIAEKLALEYENDKVLVLYIEKIHESIAGIIAGRIREKFNKPTIILTYGENMVKGSGRSIEGYDMYAGINKCSHLLERFGGHTMAAGVSLKEENIDEFRKQLNDNCILKDEDFVRRVWIDVPVPIGYINEELVDELYKLEPFGKDNEKPIFALKNVKILKLYLIGTNKNMAKIILEDGGYSITATLFNRLEEFLELISKKYGEDMMRRLKMGLTTDIEASFTYYPVINEYKGNRSLQINITGFMI